MVVVFSNRNLFYILFLFLSNVASRLAYFLFSAVLILLSSICLVVYRKFFVSLLLSICFVYGALSFSRTFFMLYHLYSTNHIYIGAIYIIIGLIGGSLGFGLSIIIRLELALPGYNNVSSLNYNSIITFHGLLMIFFMVMPILIGGWGNVLIPILIGCNDMIFPRLNLFSLWLSLFSLILIILSLLIDSGVNAGWTFMCHYQKWTTHQLICCSLVCIWQVWAHCLVQ